MLLGIDTVTVVLPIRRRQQALLFIEADRLCFFNVELAVKKSAIQILDNKSGVFVKNNSEYVFSPLQLGRSDMDYVEVIAGLKPGQLYVTTNSYLLKADIEKSEAEHDD